MIDPVSLINSPDPVRYQPLIKEGKHVSDACLSLSALKTMCCCSLLKAFNRDIASIYENDTQ